MRHGARSMELKQEKQEHLVMEAGAYCIANSGDLGININLSEGLVDFELKHKGCS